MVTHVHTKEIEMTTAEKDEAIALNAMIMAVDVATIGIITEQGIVIVATVPEEEEETLANP